MNTSVYMLIKSNGNSWKSDSRTSRPRYWFHWKEAYSHSKQHSRGPLALWSLPVLDFSKTIPAAGPRSPDNDITGVHSETGFVDQCSTGYAVRNRDCIPSYNFRDMCNSRQCQHGDTFPM